ncbi:hypothetical protein SO802_010514 [Lithocarpus litseifolius]|uniref:UDP-glucose 4-epimerase n=1 Tax=Lithocarpus litseifolius TaxID=425828 RepID=A0AAW2DEY2_9ROSI
MGAIGFIGSHTVVQLLNEGFRVSIIDNLDNSITEVVDRVRDLFGPKHSQNLEFHQGDLRNKDLEKLFSQTQFGALIHFDGLKAVGESVANPRRYFDNNLIGTINLYKVMTKYDCKKMVFSSSATVYGQPEKMPCVEDFELKTMNPYGRTKSLLPDYQRLSHRLNTSKLIENSGEFQNLIVFNNFEETLVLLVPLLASALEFGSVAAPALVALLKMGSWLLTEEFSSKLDYLRSLVLSSALLASAILEGL